MVVGWVKQALVNLVMLIQAMYLAKKVQIKKNIKVIQQLGFWFEMLF